MVWVTAYWGSAMPFAEMTRNNETLDECLDELRDLLIGLQHYTPIVLALALHAQLETLLLELLEGKVCTRAELRAFVEELERDALEGDVESPKTPRVAYS
jgi:hypothetical protein